MRQNIIEFLIQIKLSKDGENNNRRCSHARKDAEMQLQQRSRSHICVPQIRIGMQGLQKLEVLLHCLLLRRQT